MQYSLLTESSIRSTACAAFAVALLLSWQSATVHYNRGDNWTALFCTGQLVTVPPQLSAGTYRFENSTGYDGQMYRYVAHDPFIRFGLSQYIDAPVLRYRRILVPMLAYALAGGRAQWIDAAYIAIIALSVFIGSYWLSRWAVIHGFPGAWGLAFLAAPATLVSMDRMTVDVAVAAFTVGCAYYTAMKSTVGIYSALLLACLTRETAVLLVAGYVSFELFRGSRKRAVLWATACIPLVLWYSFLFTRLQVSVSAHGLPRWFARKLGWGILGRIFDPPRYELPAAWEAVTRTLDVVAFLGIIGAVIAALVLLRGPLDPMRLSAAMFALVPILLTNRTYWNDVFGYSRVFTPLLLLTILDVVGNTSMRRYWWMLTPVLLLEIRIGLQLAPQALGVFEGIVSR